ncbi:MAG: hypothetical protein O3A62_07045, partial [Actinomycetota bacterium]|nr:hypothetical protein [Actinomycetota bacterium]
MPKDSRSNNRSSRSKNRYASSGNRRGNPNSPKRIDLSGRSNRGGNRPSQKEYGLGGEQIEGRQAVRELLLGQRRRIREIWIASDIEASPVVEDILDLARDQRVQVMNVSRRELDREARSEAPQGVLAKADAIEETLL